MAADEKLLPEQAKIVTACVEDLKKAAATIFKKRLNTKNSPTTKDLLTLISTSLLEFHADHIRRVVANCEQNGIQSSERYIQDLCALLMYFVRSSPEYKPFPANSAKSRGGREDLN